VVVNECGAEICSDILSDSACSGAHSDFTGSGFSFEALSGYLPYVALFAFVILWEVLLYYAHF